MDKSQWILIMVARNGVKPISVWYLSMSQLPSTTVYYDADIGYDNQRYIQKCIRLFICYIPKESYKYWVGDLSLP